MPEVQIIQLEPKSLQNRIGHGGNLKRNVLTPDGKRWQLWGKGIKGAEAEAIIAKLYGPQKQPPPDCVGAAPEPHKPLLSGSQQAQFETV